MQKQITTAATEPSPTRDPVLDNFPALAGLRLEPGDWQVLPRQGFISRELRRGREKFKLRFRRDGRQQVRYIGGHERAVAVQADLDLLHTDIRRRRRLAALSQAASTALRAMQRLRPALQERGYHLHGLEIRKARHKNTATNAS